MDAASLELQSAFAAAKTIAKPAAVKNEAQAAKAATDFEAMFINDFLGAMFEGIETDGPTGGGPSEQIFRSMMLDQYSKTLASQGGFGLSDAIKRQLLLAQEHKS